MKKAPPLRVAFFACRSIPPCGSGWVAGSLEVNRNKTPTRYRRVVLTSFLAFGFKTYATSLDVNRKRNSLATQTFFKSVRLRGEEKVKSLKRKIFHRFAAGLLGFQQRAVQILYQLDILMRIVAHEISSFETRHGLLPCGRPRSRRGVAAFLASLHGAPPEVAEAVVARAQRIETIALRVGERAIIRDAFDRSIDAALGIVRRLFRSAVEEHVKLDLEPANVVFETGQLIVDGGFSWTNRKLVLVPGSFLRTRKAVIVFRT